VTATLPAVPRKAIGHVEPHEWADGRTVTYRARVRVNGKRHRFNLGMNHEGWSMERARVEMERIMGQIERGTWEPPSRARPVVMDTGEETLHVTASRWWQKRRDELAPKTKVDYEWRLAHLLRHLAHDLTAEIDVARVDELREGLRKWRSERGKKLSPRSINMVLDALAAILDEAVEYGILDTNPARGKRRRMRVPTPSRSFLEPGMVVSLLDAASERERELLADENVPNERILLGRRALLATLCLAGPRITELTEVGSGALDLHAGGLRLGKKTAAGRDRHLELSAYLLGELRSHLASIPAGLRKRGAKLPLFPTLTGGRHEPSNVRTRILADAVERANEARGKEGRMLLPDKVTPHTLRRTFASLSFFAGRDLRFVMGQLGHDSPSMTLSVYAQAMKRSQVDEALVWRLMAFPDEAERELNSPRFGPSSSAKPLSAERDRMVE